MNDPGVPHRPDQNWIGLWHLVCSKSYGDLLAKKDIFEGVFESDLMRCVLEDLLQGLFVGAYKLAIVMLSEVSRSVRIAVSRVEGRFA